MIIMSSIIFFFLFFFTDNTRPQLVFGNSRYIQRLSLDGDRTKSVQSGLHSAVGIDFHFRFESATCIQLIVTAELKLAG